MKKKLIIVYLVTGIFTLQCQQQVVQSPAKTSATVKDQLKTAHDIGQVLFSPVSHETPPKPDPYATISINEKAIENFYGKNGLNVDAGLLNDIKRFYFYLEYATKLEIAGKLINLAHNKGIDAIHVIENSSWSDLLDQIHAEIGPWDKVLENLKNIETAAYHAIEGTIKFNFWQDIPKTDFWEKIIVTQESLVQSMFWQRYLKYIITKTFDQIDSTLDAVLEGERRLFMYIPCINVAYYNQDFNNLRNSAEFFRIALALNDQLQTRYLSQCLDWKQITYPKSPQFDLTEIYKKSIEFKKTPFYSLVAPADQDPVEIAKKIAENKNIVTNREYAKEPFAQTELTIVAMIYNLKIRLAYLVDTQHLDNTMKILGNKNIARPTPDIFWYQPQDGPYLNDINIVLENFKKITQELPQVDSKQEKTAQVQGFFHAIKHFFKHPKETIKAIVKTVEKKVIKPRTEAIKEFTKNTINQAREDIMDAAKQVEETAKNLGISTGKAFKNEGLAVYSATEGAGILLTGDTKKAAKLFKKSGKLQEQVAQNLDSVAKDSTKLMTDTVDLAAKSAYISTAYTVGYALTAIVSDADLGEAVSRIAESAVELTGTFMEQLIAAPYGLIVFTPALIGRVISILEVSIWDIIQGKSPKEYWNDLKNQLGSITKSLISLVSFVGEVTVDNFKALTKILSYTITMIADVLLDTLVSVVRVAEFAAMPFGGEEAVAKAATEIRAHKRFTVQLVSTALIIGSAIMTGGTALPIVLPIVAMTMGPQIFIIGGAFQDDEAAKTKKAAQEQFLDDYEHFIFHNKTIAKHNQENLLKELKSKFNDQINNQERELGFYQNMLNQYLGLATEQLSYASGGFLKPQLIVNEESGLRFADVGSLYGFKTGDGKETGLLNLNPSQGFPLFNKARETFSQEVAVYPAPSLQIGNTNLTSDVITKFWFNQRETYVSKETITEVEVRWRALYVLNSFHIGLYMGGKEINISEIIKTQKAPIQAAHLAKIIVFKKENKEDPVTLKMYEHEGAGWLKGVVAGPNFNIGTWYHMKAQFANKNLKIKVWSETHSEPNEWQNFKVAPTEQKTFGMISSGASIEYEFVTPRITIQPVEKIREPITWQTESERGEKTLKNFTAIKIGAFDLNMLLDPTSIVRNHFIYSTNGDIVILGTKEGNQPMENIGASPQLMIRENGKIVSLMDSPNICLASLISSNIFDKNKTVIGYNPNILEAFEKAHGPLSEKVHAIIEQNKGAFITRISGPFMFGNIKLEAASKEDLQKGAFIYKAISPEKALQSNGKPIKDAQGNEIFDYFMAINKQGLLGTPYSDDVQQIESLVTGNVYERGKKNPIEIGYITGSQAIKQYVPRLTQVSTALSQRIDQAAQFYRQATQQPEGTKTTKSVIATQLGKAAPAVKTIEKEVPVEKEAAAVKPAQDSLEKRSDNAAAEQTAWGA